MPPTAAELEEVFAVEVEVFAVLVDFADVVLVFTELVLEVFTVVVLVEDAGLVDEGACRIVSNNAAQIAMRKSSRQLRKSTGDEG